MAERAGTNRLATAQRFLLNIGHPNIEQAIGALTPQVTYRVPGRHGLAGTIVGRDEVARHLSDLVDQTLGTFDAVKWDDWLIGEHYVAGLAQIHVQRNGRLFSGRVVYTVKFNSADLIEAVEIFVEDERSFRTFSPIDSEPPSSSPMMLATVGRPTARSLNQDDRSGRDVVAHLTKSTRPGRRER